MISKTQLKFLTSLKQKKYRLEHQQFLVDNPKVIFEEISNDALDSIFATQKFFQANENSIPVDLFETLRDSDLKKITSSVTPQGIVAVFNIVDPKEFDMRDKSILLLENIQDPGNMGTIIRTADWFGFENVFLSEDCVDIYNPKVVAASMGSIFHINIFQDLDLMEFAKELKQNKYRVIVSDLEGGQDKIDTKNKAALVIGNEAQGVSLELKSLADTKVKIPKIGQAESLNAAVAAGIFMHKIKQP
ncbi:RNA methyltransferase [Candidatus Parcubacteria bacterium]|jgi:RNA methyltransferase, TrmH family|nr:RNA methyltransferase [Candidatus Parcubacteria bacterium]